MPSSWPRLALQKPPDGSADWPLTRAAPLSSLSIAAELTIGTQDDPRHQPCVLCIAVRFLKYADGQCGSCLWSVHTHRLLYSFTTCCKILPSERLWSQRGLLAASLLQVPKGFTGGTSWKKGSKEELSVQTVFSEQCCAGSAGEQNTLCICSSRFPKASSSPSTDRAVTSPRCNLRPVALSQSSGEGAQQDCIPPRGITCLWKWWVPLAQSLQSQLRAPLKHALTFSSNVPVQSRVAFAGNVLSCAIEVERDAQQALQPYRIWSVLFWPT